MSSGGKSILSTLKQIFETKNWVLTAAEWQELDMYLCDPWVHLDFGRHAGKTLPELVFTDPQYFFQTLTDEIFHDDLFIQAAIINRRMKHILPPRPRPSKWEFLIDLGSEKEFKDFKIVMIDNREHEKEQWQFRAKHLNLSVVAEQSRAVCEKMLSRIKEEFFPEAGENLSRPDYEKFIWRNSNFDLLCCENHTWRGSGQLGSVEATSSLPRYGAAENVDV